MGPGKPATDSYNVWMQYAERKQDDDALFRIWVEPS